MINLGTFQQYQDYFKAIAEDHKELDATEPYLFGDTEVGQNSSRSWKNKKLWLEPPQPAQIQDQGSDNLLLSKPCSFVICGSPGNVKHQAEYDFYKACELILIDVIARMRKDYVEFTAIPDFASMRISWVELILGSTKLIGCRLDFTFKDPTGFAYDPLKWKSED